MKKLTVLFLFAWASTASASFVPGPIQVNASGGTATAVGYATGGSSVPVSVLNTVPVTGTFFQASQPVTVTQPTVFGATTTYNGTQIVGIVQPTVLGATVTFNGTQNVQLQTGANVIGAVTQGAAGTSFWGVDRTTGDYVVGGAAENAATTGNPLLDGVKVTSSTIPTGAANANSKALMGDAYGRVAVTGMPFDVIFSTYMIHISSAIYGVTNQNDAVLVSSPGSGLRTYLCGCEFGNTTATNGKVTLASPVNATTNSSSYAIGTAESHIMTIPIPANYFPSGLWRGCSEPFFRSALNSSISIIQNVAASKQAIDVNCMYFQAQ